jgi:predicted transglutaminase-like cysteine proteinase
MLCCKGRLHVPTSRVTGPAARSGRLGQALNVCLLVATLGVPLYPATTLAATLFGRQAWQGADIAYFPKWLRVVERVPDERAAAHTPCDPHTARECLLQDWLAFLRTVQEEPSKVQLDRVNRHMNRYPYVQDIVNWGVQDYWATPGEFFRVSGDCEDYAIAKYYSLRKIGVPAEKMHIVVVHDLNLRLFHAILVISQDERRFVLDNQIEQVVPIEAILHYRPVYAVNEGGYRVFVERPAP